MALIRDWEIPETGVVVEDAYHVIINVTTEKRLADIAPPPDHSRPEQLTARDDEDEAQWVYWKSGYIGRISLEVYSSKDARDSGKKPIGVIGANPIEAGVDSQWATKGKDWRIEFFINPDSSDSILTQAYNHLLTTEFYSSATEV